MKNLTFFLLASISLLFGGCNAGPPAEEPLSRDKLSEAIQGLSSTLEQQSGQIKVDTATVRAMIDKAQEFARRFPQDTLAPKFLFQAANVSRGIGEFSNAATIWGRVASEYEQYRRAPESLFFQAFTLDNDLKDTAQARVHYEAFLERYPKHPMAKDASLLLEVIKSGKSAEEMVKEFQQNQEEE